MKSTTLITLDLQRPNFCTVYAVQDDKLTRWVSAQLTDGGNAWTPPSGALLTIRYRKPDGTAGWYDKLEDGSRAYSISGSVVDFGLAVQSLAVPGTVQAEVSFYTSSGERLTTFLFLIEVEKDPLTDAEIVSSDYFSVLTQQVAQAAASAEKAKAAAAKVTFETVSLPSVNIPAGTPASPSMTEFDFSASAPYNSMFVAAQMSSYALPYVSGGQVLTWVESFHPTTRILVVRNATSAWNGYTLNAIFKQIS